MSSKKTQQKSLLTLKDFKIVVIGKNRVKQDEYFNSLLMADVNVEFISKLDLMREIIKWIKFLDGDVPNKLFGKDINFFYDTPNFLEFFLNNMGNSKGMGENKKEMDKIELMRKIVGTELCSLCGQPTKNTYIDGPARAICKKCEPIIERWESLKAKRNEFMKSINQAKLPFKFNAKDDISFHLNSVTTHLENIKLSIRWIENCLGNLENEVREMKKT